MDAERLIGVSRHALAASAEDMDVIAEAWQAQALARAIGHHVALRGPKELRSDARELRDLPELSGVGGGGGLPPEIPGVRAGAIRALGLSGVRDVRAALTGLGLLLGEVGIALVAVACATDEEGRYWQCIEAIDAADESSDRVGGMLRTIATREREEARERERARDREEERGWPSEWRRERGWDGMPVGGRDRTRGGDHGRERGRERERERARDRERERGREEAADSPVGPL